MSRSLARLVRLPATLALVVLAAGCSSSGGGEARTLTSVSVGPTVVTVARGSTLQLSATGTYSDATTADLTSSGTWATGDVSIATVTASGLLTGVATGSTTVTVTSAGISGSRNAAVTRPPVTSVAVAPATPDVTRAGDPVPLSARATYADGVSEDVTGQATWASAAPDQVAVSTAGSVTSPGTAIIGATSVVTARFEGAEGDSTVRVIRSPAYGPSASTDPLSPQQWHLRNLGQAAYADVGGVAGEDLRLSTAWDLGIRGAGVRIAILDDSTQIAHEDLKASVIEDASWNFADETDDPTPVLVADNHGTQVAGITSMTHGNGVGGMGVAPGAGMVAYNLIGKAAPQSLTSYVRALGGSAVAPSSNLNDVFNQSFGTKVSRPQSANPVVEAQYRSGTEILRGGRGAIYVKSAGNDYDLDDTGCAEAKKLPVTCVNASWEFRNGLPYNIVVGALDASGVHATYSTAGSALWISATAGEYGNNAAETSDPFRWTPSTFKAAIVTTDRTGCTDGAANTIPKNPNRAYSTFNRKGRDNPDCDYASTMNGTSAAAPSTTGAVALLLDARPDLTWREVKHLLAASARKVDPGSQPVYAVLPDGTYVAEQGWVTNKAGHSFHNLYGFGAVDVSEALALARTFPSGSLGAFVDTGRLASAPDLELGIPDNSVAGSPASTLSVPYDLVVEAVQVDVEIRHLRPGDLGIELTSPQGTKSILQNIRNGLAAGVDPPVPGKPTALFTGTFLSNAFYGERAGGNWTIRVVDGVAGETGTLEQWTIRVFGHK